MKKFLIFFIPVVLILFFVGCNLDKNKKSDEASVSENWFKPTESVTGDFDGVVVSIDSALLVKDIHEKDAIIIKYTVTNNTEEKWMDFALSVHDTPYQNGKQTTGNITITGHGGLPINWSKNIDPDKSVEVQVAYPLNDKSDFTIELKGAQRGRGTKISAIFHLDQGV